jgi:hypothetical protein
VTRVNGVHEISPTARLQASTEEPDWYARRLAILPYGFQVTEPVPLRDALAELGLRLLAAADRPGSAGHELPAIG